MYTRHATQPAFLNWHCQRQIVGAVSCLKQQEQGEVSHRNEGNLKWLLLESLCTNIKASTTVSGSSYMTQWLDNGCDFISAMGQCCAGFKVSSPTQQAGEKILASQKWGPDGMFDASYAAYHVQQIWKNGRQQGIKRMQYLL